MPLNISLSAGSDNVLRPRLVKAGAICYPGEGEIGEAEGAGLCGHSKGP